MKVAEEQMNSFRFSPTDFMRARRPELYSDTIVSEEPVLGRNEFEFHLDTLTQRKEEIRFEHFCRRLAEKEICPNLLPQTGPTGGGDSKVDAETFPVADSLAERWYEGDPMRTARERWAFAFSAKKKWRPKAKDDVRKIVETERCYSLIFFVTNQAVSDRDRATVEDELRKQWGIDVRILDRTWIIDRVVQNGRWEVVFQTLDIERRFQRRQTCGPLDAERLVELDELDAMIRDTERYQNSEYQLAEDCLQTALLARGLNRPRTEIDGRFDQAERIARKWDNSRQIFRIVYQRAWTANWWFDDFYDFDRLSKIAEALAIDSDWVWDLEKLVNLWQVGYAWRQMKNTLLSDHEWACSTRKLRDALIRHAEDSSKPTSALWAQTELTLMDLVAGRSDSKVLSFALTRLKDILGKVEGHLDYPVEPVVQIVQALGKILDDDHGYDDLFEAVVQLQDHRLGNSAQGRLRLERGFQKLAAGKTYDAINEFSKAQVLLRQDEDKEDFVRSMLGAALGYEAAGLLWAARANLVVALDRLLYGYAKGGQFPRQALSLLRKLVWLELQLGRVPCILLWIKWLGWMGHVVEVKDDAKIEMENEYGMMDVVLGILILRTPFKDWAGLEIVPSLLQKYSLFMSRGAALFALGYENMIRDEFKDLDSDLDKFFSQWLDQPAAKDLPFNAEWHLHEGVVMRSVILGCEIELIAENHKHTLVMAEGILGFLEASLSTAVKLKGLYSSRPYLKMEVKQGTSKGKSIYSKTVEDECGETMILVTINEDKPASMVRDETYHKALFELLARFIAELQMPFSSTTLELFFSKGLLHDRAFFAAQSPLALTNILTETPLYNIRDWDEGLPEKLTPLRNVPWMPLSSAGTTPEEEKKTDAFPIGEGPTPEDLFGVDGLKHRDLQVWSPINMPLWEKAQWSGLGFAIWPTDPPIPELILAFKDFGAGKKIFRGWRKRLGEVDLEEWIGVTIITGINKDGPAHYRVAISVSEDYLSSQVHRKEHFVQVCRMQDMEPSQTTNLDQFIYLYKKFGRYRLSPGLMGSLQSMPPYESELCVEKRRLRVVPAWQIGPGDPACAAMKGISNPVIPSDTVDPPFLKLGD